MSPTKQSLSTKSSCSISQNVPRFSSSPFQQLSPNAQVSLCSTTPYPSLQSLPPTRSPPGGTFFFHPEQYLPRFLNTQGPLLPSVCFIPSRFKDLFLFLFLTPSLSSARKAISPSLLPFPLRSRSAPTHPSDLGSEVTSSKKSSLFPTPQTGCIILSYPHMAPCFPVKPLSHHEQIGVCGNHGVIPVSSV